MNHTRREYSLPFIAAAFAVAIAASPAAAADQKPQMQQPQMQKQMQKPQQQSRSGFSRDQLVGEQVYDWGEQQIGEIKDVIVGQGGKLDGVLIDVGGGFLALGDKLIAVPIEQLRRDGERVVAKDLTRQQAANLPEYDADAQAKRAPVALSPQGQGGGR